MDNNFNQNQNPNNPLPDFNSRSNANPSNSLPLPPEDPSDEARIHLQTIKGLPENELKEQAQKVRGIRDEIEKSGGMGDFESTRNTENKMREIGMPGIFNQPEAKKQLSLREQAIFEQRNLANQDQSWDSLPQEEKDEVADRVRWGADYQGSWDWIFDRAKVSNTKFTSAPTTDEERAVNRDLLKMVGGEIELALSRNPQTKAKAKDLTFLDDLSQKIIADRRFIDLVNQEAQGGRNVRIIRTDIERLATEIFDKGQA
jgi:hypothetical protein